MAMSRTPVLQTMAKFSMGQAQRMEQIYTGPHMDVTNN